MALTAGVWEYGIPALLIGLAFLAVLFFSIRKSLQSQIIHDEEGGRIRLPMTPLQKRAWWSFGIGLVMFASILVVLLLKGPLGIFEDDGLRLLLTGLFFGGLVAYFLLLLLTYCGGSRKVLMDERDRLALGRASHVQLVAVILSQAAWAIGLTEAYWGQGSIPIVFPYLIFWSTLIVFILAGSLGIVLGYHWKT